MQKIIGILTAFAGLLMFIIVFSAGVKHGLLIAMVGSLPAFFVFFFGCSLILDGGLKKAFGLWLIFELTTMLPWIVVFPANYQVVFLSLLVIVSAFTVYWYRRKHKSSREPLQRRE